jgi:predicted DNA-binding WGR domain protein
MIHLKYTDDKSSKFWEIEVAGKAHTVRYGRIGTKGQVKTKEFESEAKAQASADKLHKEKLKKGYVKTEAEADEASAQADADSPAAKLRGLLQGLCSTDADRGVLDGLCEKVQAVSGDGPYEIEFEEAEMECSAGADVVYHDDVPRTFSEIAGVIAMVSWDAGGPEMGYGVLDSGLSEADDEGLGFLREEDEETLAKLDAEGGASAAFSCGQNWLVFDPTRKLANGEKALAFISHESVEWEPVESADEFDYKGILLRLIADQMIETDYLSEIYT